MKVKVYSKPMCTACKVAKTLMTNANVEFEEVNAMDHLDELTQAGMTNLPVIEVDYGTHGKMFHGTASAVKEFIEEVKRNA